MDIQGLNILKGCFHLMSHGADGGQVAEDLSYRKLECFAWFIFAPITLQNKMFFLFCFFLEFHRLFFTRVVCS